MMRLLLIILLGLMLVGCKTTERLVYVPEVHTEHDVREVVVRDTVHVKDSVWVRERGDTVWVEKWHTKYVERMRTDSILIERCDTTTVVVEVERRLSAKESMLISIGKGASALIALIVCLMCAWIFLKLTILR